MSLVKFKRFVYLAVFCVLSLAALLCQSTGFATFKIGNAVPQLALMFSCMAGFYFGGYHGVTFGLVFGALTDVYSSTICYNTVVFAIMGFVSGMLITYLFNRNLAAISVLTAASAIIYFFFKWLIFYAFTDMAAGYIFLHYMLSSALLTVICGLVIYFALNPFYKKLPVQQKSEQYDF